MTETELVSIINAVPPLIEQLSKAFVELKSYQDLTSDEAQLEDIEEHFRHLDLLIINQFLGLGIQEKALRCEQSDAQLLVAAKEVDVYAKEQAMLDRLQELKDVAVTAIAEARSKHHSTSLQADVGDCKDDQSGSDPQELVA